MSVNNLLATSARTRQQWDGTVLVSDVSECADINDDVSQLSDIAQERMTELSQAKSLQTGAIPNGSALKSQLMQALQISLQIDNDYLAWAQQQQNSGCTTGTNSTYYDEATSEDNTATDDKQNFITTWNPVASQYNLQQFSAGQI